MVLENLPWDMLSGEIRDCCADFSGGYVSAVRSWTENYTVKAIVEFESYDRMQRCLKKMHRRRWNDFC